MVVLNDSIVYRQTRAVSQANKDTQVNVNTLAAKANLTSQGWVIDPIERLKLRGGDGNNKYWRTAKRV